MKTYAHKVTKCLAIIGCEYNSLTEEAIKINNTTREEVDQKIDSLQYILRRIKEHELKQNLKERAKAMKELYDITKYFIKLNDNKLYYETHDIQIDYE